MLSVNNKLGPVRKSLTLNLAVVVVSIYFVVLSHKGSKVNFLYGKNLSGNRCDKSF